MNLTDIKDLYRDRAAYADKEVTVATRTSCALPAQRRKKI